MFFKQRFCQLVLHEELNASPSDVYVASFFFFGIFGCMSIWDG